MVVGLFLCSWEWGYFFVRGSGVIFFVRGSGAISLFVVVGLFICSW